MAVTAPRRLQRQRSAGWRKPAGAVCVSRPSRYGNPYRITRTGHAWTVRHVDPAGAVLAHHGDFATKIDAAVQATALYRILLTNDPALLVAVRRDLAGRDLLCWCPPGAPCHGDILLDVANTEVRAA